MNIVFVLALSAKLTGAMVTRNTGGNYEEPTTLPTDLYKPLTPLKDKGTPSANPMEAANYDNTNYNNGFREVFGSSSFTNNNNIDIDSESDDEDNTSFRYPPSMNNINPYSGNRNGFMRMPLPQNNPSIEIQAQLAQAANLAQLTQASHFGQFPSRNPFPQGNQGFFPFNNYETYTGSNHYQISSSRTYFNSDTMAAPITQNYHYDSRNGGAFSNN